MDTPQLFERSPLATNADNPLGFSHSSSTELPLYLVDVNVLKKQGEPANARLAGLVFPDRLRQGTLTANDLSDISHLETAIHHSLSGFIAPSNRTRDEDVVRELLMAHGLSAVAIAGTWLSPLRTASAANRFCAWVDDEFAGYVTWTPDVPGAKQTLAWAIADERHVEAPNIARLLLRALLDSTATNGPREIRLELVAHQSELRDRAHQHGFHSTRPHRFLVKIAAGRLLTPSSWRSGRDAISSACDFKLPLNAPTYSEAGQQIEVLSPDGFRRYVPLDTLESYLSPVLLCLRADRLL